MNEKENRMDGEVQSELELALDYLYRATIGEDYVEVIARDLIRLGPDSALSFRRPSERTRDAVRPMEQRELEQET